MKFILSFSDARYSFTTLADANEAQAVVRVLNPNIYSSVTKIAGPLCSWTPDSADMYALQFMVAGNDEIHAIKYARMKSGSGLKEAKDWVLANFIN